MSIEKSSYHYRLQILNEADKSVYVQSGDFFDSIRSISDIDLTNLGFGGKGSIDNITVKEVTKKIGDLGTDTSKKFTKSKSTLEQYDKLKKYIQLKDRIGNLNLPEEVKSIEDRDEYQKAVLYHLIITRWEQYINGKNERLVNSINELNTLLTYNDKYTYVSNIPWEVINEIENMCKTNLRFKLKLELDLGGSTRKRKSSASTRRRPSRKSSAIKRRPHRRTSRK